MVPTPSGTAERRQRSGARDQWGVGASHGTREAGEPDRRDPVEGRRRRNADPFGGKMGETSSSQTVSTKLERIANLAKQVPAPLTTLAHHIDIEWLREAHRRTRKDGARGVDGQSAEEYERDLEGNLAALLGRVKAGTYRAPPVRRVYIPKSDGQQRPLGIPTYEDKVLQRAVAMMLEAVYEQEFLDCSYGFRPGRSAHQALGALRDTVMEMKGAWVLEVDVQKYFDTIDHEQLRNVLHRRIGDGAIQRLIGKWLNAGVMEEGEHRRTESGTPQGGVISPMLANIFLHDVLDTWFERDVKPRLGGRAKLVRFADDFVIAFEREEDAHRVKEVLPKRFGKFGLTLPLRTTARTTMGTEGANAPSTCWASPCTGRSPSRTTGWCRSRRPRVASAVRWSDCRTGADVIGISRWPCSGNSSRRNCEGTSRTSASSGTPRPSSPSPTPSIALGGCG
jgi:group II intron reverse transcriptase/maturase